MKRGCGPITDQTEETKQQVRKNKIILRLLTALSLFLLAAAVFAGLNLSPIYFWGVLPSAILAGTTCCFYLRFKRLKNLLTLRERWQNKVKKERDFKVIAALHEYLQASGKSTGIVDEQTWYDLELERLYGTLDRTFTSEGQAVLYHMLKHPCYSLKPLQERAAIIKAFQEDVSFREQFQLELLPLEVRNDKDITGLLWNPLPPPSPYAPLFTVLALAAFLSLFSPLLLGINGVLLIASLFGVNIFVHHKVNRNIIYMLPAVSSLAALLRAAMKIGTLEKPALEERCEALREATAACKKITNKARFLHPKVPVSDLDILYAYVNYFFLLEVRAFYSTLGEIDKQIGKLREIYLTVGEMDALQSVASYRESLPCYTEPKLSVKSTPHCEIKAARHPLLKDAVPNSISMDGQGLMVTGSNMSGKSTFLRTMGLNALMAQTIYTCTAASYQGSFMRIITSISLEDSLAEGKSYYYREAERLLKLIQAAGEDEAIPAFCIVDELLSGTNYTERLAASESILEYLARKHALVIVATHDLDLAEKLQSLYRCFHFTDQVGPEGLFFDYKLKEGISTTRNAIKLLEHLGYPRDVVAQANSLAAEFAQE